MEIHLIYAIASFLINWILNFVFKVVTQREYSVSMFNYYSYIITALISFVYFLLTPSFNHSTIWFIILFWFLNAFFYIISVFTRIESLKNIDTVIFSHYIKHFDL